MKRRDIPITRRDTSDYFVSVVAFLENCGDALEPFIIETASVLKANYENYELVLVDDGSRDQTRGLADELLRKYEGVRYLRLSRHFGIETAIAAGLDTVIGDYVVIMDPRGDPPSLIPRMVEKLRNAPGVVYGVQVNADREQSVGYRLGKKVFHALSKTLFKFAPPKNAGYFMGLTRGALNAIVQIKDRSRFLRIFGAQVGFRTSILEYQPVWRRGRAPRKSVRNAIGYAIGAITTNSTRPLRLAAYLGLFAAFLNVLYIGYVFLVALLKDQIVEGWISTALQSSVMFLLLFTILAVISEYVLRLVTESKQQPAYFIEQEQSSSIKIPGQARKRNVFRESHV